MFIVCSGRLDKMEEQEIFYVGELVSIGDRIDNFFLSFGCRLWKLTLVRVERISYGSEILWSRFSGMAISSFVVLHFNIELKKRRAVLEVAFYFIYQPPLYSTAFRISREDYFVKDELHFKIVLTHIFGILQKAVFL